MAVRIQVVCSHTQHGDIVKVVGADQALGAWDPARALPLLTTEETFPTWSGDIAAGLAGESPFKVVVARASGEIEWEPFDGDRAWPMGVEVGSTLEMEYGNPLVEKRSPAPKVREEAKTQSPPKVDNVAQPQEEAKTQSPPKVDNVAQAQEEAKTQSPPKVDNVAAQEEAKTQSPPKVDNVAQVQEEANTQIPPKVDTVAQVQGGGKTQRRSSKKKAERRGTEQLAAVEAEKVRPDV